MTPIEKHMYKVLVSITLFALGFGTVLYHFVEKWSYIDSFYFCVVSLATVGYGDFVPKTQFGRLFTSFYIIVGIAILGAFVNAFSKKQAYRMQERARSKEDKHKQ